MYIRRETESDFFAIYNLIKEAFKTADVSTGDEQEFALQLRETGAYIPELALVAEDDGARIGHIMLTKTYVMNDGEPVFEGLLLAPISVARIHRNKGVGTALINESFKRAAALGYKAVFLCGDPNYYHRFGFKSAILFGITHALPCDDANVMAYELEEGALNNVSGALNLV